MPAELKIDFKRLWNLLVSTAMALIGLWWAHAHFEAELALGEKRDWKLLACYAAVGILSILVSPSIRERIVPGVQSGAKLYVTLKNAFGGKVTVTAEMPKPEPPKESSDG